MTKTRPKKKSSGATQRRGDARRQELLRAAHTLLQTRNFHEITYVSVCERAGIPHGSARHFYPDLDALLRGLFAEFGERHDDAIKQPLRGNATKSWQSLVHCLIDRSAAFQQRNPVCAKLTIGGHMPPELKRLDRDADFDRARHLLERLDEFFVLPRQRDTERVAYFAIEVIDTAFMLSMRECQQVTPWWVKQAKRGAIAVLAQHFDGDLEPRPWRG